MFTEALDAGKEVRTVFCDISKVLIVYGMKGLFTNLKLGPPGVMGIWGEWLFIFRDLGSSGYYFRGAGEQAHSFGDQGSPAKKQKK